MVENPETKSHIIFSSPHQEIVSQDSLSSSHLRYLSRGLGWRSRPQRQRTWWRGSSAQRRPRAYALNLVLELSRNVGTLWKEFVKGQQYIYIYNIYNQINEQSMQSKLPAPEKMRGPNKPEICFLLRRIFGRLSNKRRQEGANPFPCQSLDKNSRFRRWTTRIVAQFR